ncbi:hormogonium polysaccharide secretion pseudopilin HpsC [Roseofilum sp. BLCC_M91]|uniref:Hormogonium polysaccharide secretion pseudopilin HpsC n=1 Tax=Roseofilum halophilum BLCC-M91 TaxID=3022259 RepID=A0ABT7BHW7_9CYAN|nr:hormogonium polysaccharide secretion pseudopilin HpsC [Roseofilum halophilum]MDJ1178784.1 hormogonium polysaccharide secretion pseudopilin HpsC [Roseofilum halophilum BLCC-M91]
MFMLLNGLLKSRRQGRRNQGFTLIELLVALVVSSIMISSLLGFMVDIVRKDRNEQVKSATQQEIQSAADYIRRDLETAVYIYDGEGLRAISGNYSTTECTNPQSPGSYTPPASCSQIPVIADGEGIPVLAFWKRKFLDKELNVTVKENPTSRQVGQLVKLPNGDFNDQDYQVYALVVYYLTRDSNNTWSNAMQIRRVELRDGIVDTGGNPQDGEVNSVKYDLQPSPGYANFDLSISGDSIHEKMNKWQKTATAFDLSKTPIQVLVDNIDHTTLADLPTNTSFPNTVDCQAAFPNKEAPTPAPTAPDEPWQSPNYGASDFPTAFDGLKTDSFFTCVDSEAGVAQVYIRGNALARISPTDPDKYEPGNDRVMFFFPTTSMQTKIRGRVQ